MWNCTIAYTYCNIRSSVKWHLCMVRDLIVESRQKKIILFLSFSQDSINKWYLYMYMIHVFWNTVESRIYCFLGGLWFLNEKQNAYQRKLIDVEMLELLLAVKLFSRAHCPCRPMNEWEYSHRTVLSLLTNSNLHVPVSRDVTFCLLNFVLSDMEKKLQVSLQLCLIIQDVEWG